MNTKKYVYWEDDKMWIGFLEEFPDYITQGNTLSELQESLVDIYHELTSGNIPNVRHLDELEIA